MPEHLPNVSSRGIYENKPEGFSFLARFLVSVGRDGVRRWREPDVIRAGRCSGHQDNCDLVAGHMTDAADAVRGTYEME